MNHIVAQPSDKRLFHQASLNAFRDDRYLAAINACFLPIARHLARVAATHFGVAVRGDFSIGDFGSHPDGRYWFYGFMEVHLSPRRPVLFVVTEGESETEYSLEISEDVNINHCQNDQMEALLPALVSELLRQLNREADLQPTSRP